MTEIRLFKSGYNSAHEELNFIWPEYFLHTYSSSNAGNFVVFCFHKNTRLQNETNISGNFDRL